jgi:hypothetical protein
VFLTICVEAERFVQCLVPVIGSPGLYHVGFIDGKGIVHKATNLINRGRAAIWGGTADQYKAYDIFVKKLNDVSKNINTYKKSGDLVTRVNELIKWAEIWENNVAVGENRPAPYPNVTQEETARPPAYSPYAAPAQAVPTAPLPPPQYPPPPHPQQYPQYPPPPYYPPPPNPPPGGYLPHPGPTGGPMPNLVLHVPHCGLTRACP